MTTAGYSGTPLAKKLGFKEGSRVRIKNAPDDYLDLVNPRPENVHISKSIRKDVDIFHFFTRSSSELKSQLPRPVFGLLLSPMIASAAMTFSSVSVISNALRLHKLAL